MEIYKDDVYDLLVERETVRFIIVIDMKMLPFFLSFEIEGLVTVYIVRPSSD